MANSPGEVRDLNIDAIDIGTAQVRTDLNSGIEDLAKSINKQGLLQPIVAADTGNGRYEILAGQRRFLACKQLGHESIRAVVVDTIEDEAQKVAISLTENLVRRGNTQKELIDACTKLYKRYTSIKLVAEETGLTANEVSKYVKYDQLIPPLQDMVDNAKLDMKVALQAQTAASDTDGSVDAEAAAKYAQELKPMSNAQQKKFVKTVQADPTASLEEKIEKGRKQPKLRQVIVTLEESMHQGLQSFASDEGVNQDEAAANLIEDGLSRRGLLGAQ